MTQFITQNPLVALILAIVPVAAVMWKVFYELYVKPRDFRIDMLKDDMARLSSQLEELRTPETPRVVAGSGHADGPHTEVQRSDSTALETLSSSAAQRPTRADQVTGASRSPADSLAALYQHWKDPAITDLQKQKFQNDWIGKDVRWLVWVDSVGEISHGRIFVSVRDGPGDQFDAPRSILVCPERDAEMLLTVRPDDAIVVSGKIHEFFIAPSVYVSSIERA